MALDHPAAPFAPLLAEKDYAAPSVFEARAMMREAARQKGLKLAALPEICILDPDGDLLAYVQAAYGAVPVAHWPCYHTKMFAFEADGRRIGIIGHAVGAAFAVLLAEQFFAAGGFLLLSLSSAGQIAPAGPPPYFVLIDKALRDEGTSYHYAPPADYAAASPALLARAAAAMRGTGAVLHVGASWTTDAPFRETSAAITSARARGILCVEMEAAALYAFAAATENRILCLAQITNQLGLAENDFEKGEQAGATASLTLLLAACGAI
jgi:purine-nucleoside phosphorylase